MNGITLCYNNLMNSHIWSTLFLSALVGVIVSLPTGPTGAYVVSRRMSESAISMMAAIIAVVITDHLYIVGILEGKSYIVHITQNVWILIGFCLAVMGLGIYKVLHPTIATRTKSKNISFERVSNSATESALVAAIINASNPLLVLSLISLLTTFGLNDGSHNTITIIIGFSIGCIGLWALIGVFLQHSFQYAQEHLRIIIQGCGVLMIISALITLGRVVMKVV